MDTDGHDFFYTNYANFHEFGRGNEVAEVFVGLGVSSMGECCGDKLSPPRKRLRVTDPRSLRLWLRGI